jgi:hypothetical protein
MSNLLLNNRSNTFLATLVRRLSSFNNNKTKTGIISLVPNDDYHNTWADNNWSEFGKQFNNSSKFPLPGQTGTSTHLTKKVVAQKTTPKINLDLFVQNMEYILKSPLAQEAQAVKLREATDTLSLEEAINQNCRATNSEPIFELKAYNCPKSLLNDFQSYFRMNSIGESAMTVVTISFKSEHDMALWNSRVETEREFLTEKFVDTAQEMCQHLEQEGFWADFIDPSSGTLHRGPYTHATFYEADERYQTLGFEIIDMGCCKVISHHEWGTRTYVGCVLTNASVNDKFLKRLLSNKA